MDPADYQALVNMFTAEDQLMAIEHLSAAPAYATLSILSQTEDVWLHVGRYHLAMTIGELMCLPVDQDLPPQSAPVQILYIFILRRNEGDLELILPLRAARCTQSYGIRSSNTLADLLSTLRSSSGLALTSY